MSYQELIKKVQLYSGLPDEESKDALDCLVESLAVRLDDRERLAFATQLPPELQDMALAVYPSAENSQSDLLEQFMQLQHVARRRALKELSSAWQALKDTYPSAALDQLVSRLPYQSQAWLRS